MNDRELLELAAKAEGHGVYFDANSGNTLLDDEYTGILWNPLHNDGDALRLAVKIPVCIVIDNEMKWCGVHLQADRGKYEFVEHFSNDSAAATRRAIVRAAAEIGKDL